MNNEYYIMINLLTVGQQTVESLFTPKTEKAPKVLFQNTDLHEGSA